MKARALALLLVAASLAPAPAPAAHGPSCGGTWKGSDHCQLSLRGLPTVITGEAFAQGTASVHVRLIFSGPHGDRVIAECSASAPSKAKCEDRIDYGVPVDPFVGLVPLNCAVQGTSNGSFRCWSATPNG